MKKKKATMNKLMTFENTAKFCTEVSEKESPCCGMSKLPRDKEG